MTRFDGPTSRDVRCEVAEAPRGAGVGTRMPGNTVERKTGMVWNRHRWRLAILLAIVVGGLGWVGWILWEGRSYRKAMAELAEDIDAGRNALAARKLIALLDWKPRADEAAYLLGMCEKRGAAPRRRSKPGLGFPPVLRSPRAIQGRMELEVERGQLADAEQIMNDALKDPRINGTGLPILLGPYYYAQGRVDELERLIEAHWNHLDKTGEGTSEQAINLVRLHMELRWKTTSAAEVRALLDHAAQLAPSDDRIWLGKARLAIRAGSYDEAARWLDACLRRRPDDVPVWRCRLEWATATGRVAEAKEAMAHLPMTTTELQKLDAWFARQLGDTAAERLALDRLITADPTDFKAWDRLIELVVKDGQPDRAAELRRGRTEFDRLQTRYQQLYERYQPERDAAEMAHLAQQLGRRFEARAFLTLAVAVEPDRRRFAE